MGGCSCCSGLRFLLVLVLTMSKGLVKPKKYDWKDSNLALFGSDLEKNIKRESAEGEPAWHGSGQKVGTQIWRIVKFKVDHWPEEDYGKFYSGDSYIILHTYKKDPDSAELDYDVHFWIGKYSTQDEYGTAAYKTVELDHYHGDKPVQHREVMGNESNRFKSYFKTIQLLKGGADSGFNKVTPEEYKPRLLRCQKVSRTSCTLTEVGFYKESFNPNDVFIVDQGTVVYQINGRRAAPMEKHMAAVELQKLENDRNGRAKGISCNEESADGRKVINGLPHSTKGPKRASSKPAFTRTLFRLSDAGGHLKLEEVAKGNAVARGILDSADVFILDTGCHCFVWVGCDASVDERHKSMQYAHNYLMKTEHALVPISVIIEGKDTDEFCKAI